MPQPPNLPLNQPVKRANSMDETILQLRQVVKRVIIFLRVLNSFTRMMPGYKLHHALMVEKEYLEQKLQQQQNQQQYQNQQHYGAMYNQYYGHRLEGGGPGLRGGYYNTSMNGPNAQSPSSLSSEKRNLIGGSIKFLFCVSSDTTTSTTATGNSNMKSTTTIPRSPAEQRDLNLTQQRLFSSTTNRPFARHDLSPIPTPYGTLYFTALYDESLNVERVMMARAQRLMEWDRFMNVSNGIAGGAGGSPSNGSMMAISKAIPIKGNDIDNHHYNHRQQHDGGGYVNQNKNWRHSYHPQSVMQQGHHQQQPYHLQNQHQQQQQQPMSLPNNIISNRLIHNYAKSPVEASYMNNAANGLRNDMSNTNSKNIMENTEQLRDRMGSDPGYTRRGSGGKRVLSGLSLALMNDQQEEDSNQQQHSDRSLNGTLSSSPSNNHPTKIPPTLSQSPIPPTASNEEAASWKQRVALHHPPPSFFEVPNAASESPSNGKGLLSSQQQQQQQQQPALGGTHKYGYGYNHGKGIPVPIQNFRDSNSPSPVVPLVNTPPQPMFIGSFPRHGGEQMTKANSNRDIDDGKPTMSPPFRNPDSLQEIATAGDHSVSTQSILQPMRPVATSGVTGLVSSSNFKASSQVQSNNTTENLLLPPLTKSDGLASSPFKFPIPGSNPNLPYNTGSAFSSLTLGKGSAMAFGQESDGLPLAVTSGIFGGSVGNASSMGPGRSGSELMFRNSFNAGLNLDRDRIDSEDMPFAIDTEMQEMTMAPVAANSMAGLRQSSNHDPNVPMSLSSGTVSSQVVTSFAHKCATAQPLQLFNSSANILAGEDRGDGNRGVNHIEESMDALTCQLDDLKAFGESIMSST